VTTTAEPVSGLARRPAVLLAALSALAFAVLAGLLVPWDWVPGGTLVPAAPGEVFTPEEIALAEEFSGVRRYLGWSSYAISLGVACALGFTPWGARLVRAVSRRLRWWWAVPVGVGVLLLLGRAVTLPFSVLQQQRELDYGLSNQAWVGWVGDYAKSFLVAWVLSSLVVLVVVAAARRSPRYWFAWAGGLVAAMTLAASYVYPVVVEPLFNEFTSMPAGPFKSSILQLAEEEGVEVDDVLVSDASRRTTTVNAYVSGFGDTRRVVVYDNLLAELTPAEARVVIAHELAHARHGDVLAGTLLGAVGGVLGVSLLALLLDAPSVRRRAGVSGPGEPAAAAVVLALVAVGGFLSSPVQNTISRAVEARADRESIAVTERGDVFIEMQHELAVHSLSDPTPPVLSHFWFGSHPTVLQRAGLPASLGVAGK
jgi:STE24 endopeptidase